MDKISGLNFLKLFLCSALFFTIIFLYLNLQRDLNSLADFLKISVNQIKQENIKLSDHICENIGEVSEHVFEFIDRNDSQNVKLSEKINSLNTDLISKIELTQEILRVSGDQLNETLLSIPTTDFNEITIKAPSVINEQERESILEKVFNEGFTLYSKNKYRDALSIFEEAVSLYPFDSELRYYYLSCLYYSGPENIGNYDYIKEELKLYTYNNQFSEKSLCILAEISLAEDNLDEASDIYTRLYEEDESNLQYLRSLAMIEFQRGKYDEAIRNYSSYLHSYPEDYEVVYFNGISLYNRGRYNEALEQFYLVQKSENPYGNIDKKINETLIEMENS